MTREGGELSDAGRQFTTVNKKALEQHYLCFTIIVRCFPKKKDPYALWTIQFVAFTLILVGLLLVGSPWSTANGRTAHMILPYSSAFLQKCQKLLCVCVCCKGSFWGSGFCKHLMDVGWKWAPEDSKWKRGKVYAERSLLKASQKLIRSGG